ncbi:hypothetical protein F511_26983 [Dorcoceras hygrometricum]|uniref:Uncharacterized protein n=1 Tax=Dorcoceras hygrometricum TaxID=472368 RepID=A0A2Z7AIP6_9LAMI|nr:hypothetical protein F511_26983 [Dorcoceras hygrometricum]
MSFIAVNLPDFRDQFSIKSEYKAISGKKVKFRFEDLWYRGPGQSRMLGIRIRPPARQRKNKKQVPGGDQYEESDNYNCGSLRQSGPRPDPRLLRQAELEALTRSARTNTPRKTRSEQFPAKWRRRRAAHDGGVSWEGREAATLMLRV